MSASFEPVEKVAKPLTFAGTIIIFLSILKSYVFYATYGIRFTNYISFSEAILLFVNEIAIMLLYFGFLFSVLVLLHLISGGAGKRFSMMDLLIPGSDSAAWHQLSSLVLYCYPLMYLHYALVTGAGAYGSGSMAVLFACFGALSVWPIIYYTIQYWKRVNQRRATAAPAVLRYSLCLAILVFYTWSLKRQLYLYHGNQINKLVVAYRDNQPSVLSSHDVQYLGSTADYLFFYDHLSRKAIVIDATKYDRVEYGAYPRLPGFSIFDLLYH